MWEGRWGDREKGIEGYYDWHIRCEGYHRTNSVAQRRKIVTLWHLTTLMDSDCNGVSGGLDNMGECSNHIVFMRNLHKSVYQ